MKRPILIAHRGASGELPEHTLAAYERAVERGADFIEPDLVTTKDGVLVSRHENEISTTTDVAAHPEFADRKTTKTVDGTSQTGWFTEDFLWSELQKLRCRERLPKLRPANARFDGMFAIPSLDEIIALAKRLSEKHHRTIGIYPETKHPSYFQRLGLPLEPKLLVALTRAGWTDADAPVFIQSFEVENLKWLKAHTKLRLIQLFGEGSNHASAEGLRRVAEYAAGIGPAKALICAVRSDGTLSSPTGLVSMAHDAGLLVHPWTFRIENAFLPPVLRRGERPEQQGDLEAELKAFLATGIDGFFSDNPREAALIIKQNLPA